MLLQNIVHVVPTLRCTERTGALPTEEALKALPGSYRLHVIPTSYGSALLPCVIRGDQAELCFELGAYLADCLEIPQWAVRGQFPRMDLVDRDVDVPMISVGVNCADSLVLTEPKGCNDSILNRRQDVRRRLLSRREGQQQVVGSIRTAAFVLLLSSLDFKSRPLRIVAFAVCHPHTRDSFDSWPPRCDVTNQAAEGTSAARTHRNDLADHGRGAFSEKNAGVHIKVDSR